MTYIEKQAKENLEKFNECLAFIKSLDDKGVEEFISFILEEENFPDTREELRKTFKNIRKK